MPSVAGCSRLRNDLPMPVTIAALGREAPPGKISEGYFRFVCPHCGEMRATVNPRNNLAHCFCCQKNLNNIDLLITEGYDFLSAVALLDISTSCDSVRTAILLRLRRHFQRGLAAPVDKKEKRRRSDEQRGAAPHPNLVRE